MRAVTASGTALPLTLFVLSCALGSLCPEAWAQAQGQPVPESLLERWYGPYAPLMRQVAQAILQTGIVCAVALPFQAFFPGIVRKPKILSYEYWLDILYWLQGIWLGLASFFVLADWVVLSIYGNSSQWIPALAKLPYWAQVLIAVWTFDFIVYWRHRLEHTFVGLWAFHAVHHSAEKVDILTTSRLHPFEILLGAILNTFVIRVGLTPSAVALGFTLYLYYNYFIHTNVRIRFSGFLRYVFVTPFMHQWHHATDDAAAGKNLGVVFAWNDWLFGTAYHPQHWPSSFGFTAPRRERLGQSYWWQMFYPLQLAFARLTAPRAKPAPDSVPAQ